MKKKREIRYEVSGKATINEREGNKLTKSKKTSGTLIDSP